MAEDTPFGASENSSTHFFRETITKRPVHELSITLKLIRRLSVPHKFFRCTHVVIRHVRCH